MSDVVPLPDPAAESGTADPAAVSRARVRNLLGLCTPVANLGMRLTAPPSLRWFGVGAGIVLLGAAAWAWTSGLAVVALVLAGVHAALVLSGIVNPRFPELAGRAWIGLGALLGRVMAVPVFTLLYFLAVTPTALLVRLFGRDPLGRGDPPRESYWVPRDPVPPERFERQF